MNSSGLSVLGKSCLNVIDHTQISITGPISWLPEFEREDSWLQEFKEAEDSDPVLSSNVLNTYPNQKDINQIFWLSGVNG